MAYLMRVCSKCKNEVSMYVSQSLIGNRIDWHSGYSCKSCGNTVEMDWIGSKPDDEITKAIEDQDGKWRLTIRDVETSKVKILKTLRSELGLTLGEAKEILEKMGEFRFEGTLAEAKKIANALSIEKVETNLEKI